MILMPPMPAYSPVTAPDDDLFIAVAHASSPGISLYRWTGSAFGAKIGNTVELDTSISGIAISPNHKCLAVALASSPYVRVYSVSRTGFGPPYSSPATLPGGWCRNVVFSPDGAYIAVAQFDSPYVSCWNWSTTTGFGVKLTDPATTPTGIGFGVSFNANSQYLAVAHASSPAISVYPVSTTAIGTKVSNPASLPGGDGTCVCFADISPSSPGIVVGSTASPYIHSYPWNGTAFGTKHGDPSPLPASQPNSIQISTESGASICGYALNASPYYEKRTWQQSDGMSGAGPHGAAATLPTGAGNGFYMCRTPYFAFGVAHNTSPYVSVYDSSAPPVKYSNPSTLPAGNGKSLVIFQIGS